MDDPEKASSHDDTPRDRSVERGETTPYIDPEVERRALRKFDFYVLPQMMLLMLLAYFFTDLMLTSIPRAKDRSNIGNAKVFGLEKGLHLHGTQFNNISTVFYATYVLFEVPWVMAVKRFGANNVLALALVSWSVVTLCTGFIQNYAQAIVMRLLLGAAEAGLFPSLSFTISTIWDRRQCAKRICLLYMSAALSGAVGGLIAYGIQTMGKQLGLAAWRWLFIIEGAISVAICTLAWFTLPNSAEKAWFLNAEDRAVMQARKTRDAVYKGPDGFQMKYVRQAFTDPAVYLAAVLQFSNTVSQFGFSTFLPTILAGFGYSSLQANYLSIPCYVLAAISLISWTTLSDYLNKRAIIGFLAPLSCVLGYAIVVGTANKAAGYAAMFLCGAGIYSYNAILTTWVANNLASDYKRSVGIPLFVCLANISGVVASQIYPAADKPRYLTGNAVSLALEAVACVGVLPLWFLWKRRDQRKEKLLAEGVADNGHAGEDRGLEFRYTL